MNYLIINRVQINLIAIILFLIATTIVESVKEVDQTNNKLAITIGPCKWVINRECPDNDIKYYLYTRRNAHQRQYLKIGRTWEQSNISHSYFNPHHEVKIILHGYNSDMYLTPLIDMKDEYLDRGEYNLIYVDWSVLAVGPCYPGAVQNVRHVGKCAAQLVERILEAGTANMHVIGFSLGAHLANFIAQNLKSFKIPRITALDPALPLFTSAVPLSDKLDPSDALFVDVIHTNALVQGQIERCGHADFYMNGGVYQPGCLKANENPFSCSHHRAPDYYSESIRSEKGFWGWSCSSYLNYMFGFCPPTNYRVLAGEDCATDTEGIFFIDTNTYPPFALGRWENLKKTGTHYSDGSMFQFADSLRRINPLAGSSEDPSWQKINGHYNNKRYRPRDWGTEQPTKRFSYPQMVSVNLDDIVRTGLDEDDYMRPPPLKKQENFVNAIKKMHEDIVKTAEEEQDPIYQYKRNLTKGFIDYSRFNTPVVLVS